MVTLMYTLICKRAYLPLLDRIRGVRFRETLREAERNQHLSLEELRLLQDAKLRRILQHAEQHCPFYTESFQRAGVSAKDIRGVGDLPRVPALTKAEVFEHRDRMISNVRVGKLFRGTTSGSTGIATTFFYDSSHSAWVEACLWRGRRWWGVERGDRQLVLWARPVEESLRSDLKTAFKYRLRNSVQFDTFREFDEAHVSQVVATLRSFRPVLVYGYGSSVARVAEVMGNRGETLSRPPRLVEYTADHMYGPEQETAARVFSAPVVSGYGASECGSVGQQCPAGNMHISVDQAVVEFLRPDGSPAAPGETAEIVLTTLNNFGMPLIRYRVGDLGSCSAGTCPCGRALPLMSLQAGKAVDLISTSARSAVSAHVLDYVNLFLLKHGIRGIKQFFVEQQAPDVFQLTIIKDAPFDPRSVEVFVEKMRAYLGESIQVQTRFADEIPLQPTGKRRYFKKSF